MFNYSAEQIFVLQPRNTGGGILSLLLSLDSRTAFINFKQLSTDEKLHLWNEHTKNSTNDAHLAGFNNFSSELHNELIASADFCNRYVHKNHFYELDSLNDQKYHPLLDQITGEKKSIGIYLTDACIEKLYSIRLLTPRVDFYQKWMYNNQKKLLKEFYNINSLHHFSFSEMLDKDMFVDHLKYCKDLLNLDIDIDVSAGLIDQWYSIIKYAR